MIQRNKKGQFVKGKNLGNTFGFKKGVYQGYGFKKGNPKPKNAHSFGKGKDNPIFKGGKPKCLICEKELTHYKRDKYCIKHRSLGFTKEQKLKASISQSNAHKGIMPTNIMGNGKFKNIKRGWFNINGKRMFFRSKWEVNYALYLDWLVKEKQILKWEYEADVFMFEKIKLGTRSYRPDFKVYNLNGTIEYHEVKGWMDKRSITKIKRMRIYYPQIKLIVIESVGYKDLVKKVGRICGFI